MYKGVTLLITLTGLLILGMAYAGTYTMSAHGNEDYGVKRFSTSQYTVGHCGHCHEQHASIGGVEPAPTGGPHGYLLFNPNFVDQSTNFCYDCHVQSGGYQVDGIINYSYSYAYGGNDTPGSYDFDIKQAFSHAYGSGSSHFLPDIVDQVLGKSLRDASNTPWSLPGSINPCSACHNPHMAQRNMPGIGGELLTAVSRPSDPDNLWGDGSGQRMSAEYNYQAPYWYNSTIYFEPARNLVQDGSNQPNFVVLCTDCHNTNNTIYSTNPGLPRGPRELIQIDWGESGDKHGRRNGDAKKLLAPYSGQHTLSCLDCHEPHGSRTNIYLLRISINGRDVSVGSESNAHWENICYGPCHQTHHTPGGQECSDCHRHGQRF